MVSKRKSILDANDASLVVDDSTATATATSAEFSNDVDAYVDDENVDDENVDDENADDENVDDENADDENADEPAQEAESEVEPEIVDVPKDELTRLREQSKRDRIAILKREKFQAMLVDMAKDRSSALKSENDAREVAKYQKAKAARLEKAYYDLLIKGPDQLELDESPLITIAEKADASFEAVANAVEESAEGVQKDFEKNCWREMLVEELQGRVKQKTYEIVAANFDNLGALGDWLSLGENRGKIKGLTQKRIDELSEAIQVFYADEEKAEFDRADAIAAEREKKQKEEEEKSNNNDDNVPLTDDEREIVRNAIIPQVDNFLETGEVWEDFDPDFYYDVKSKFLDDPSSLTRAQYVGLQNILNGFLQFD